MSKNVSALLLDQHPLIVSPALASVIGLNEAIIVQQLHYWIQRSNNVRDGETWAYNTYAQWHEQFPFWSEHTIRRSIGKLEASGIIISTDKYNQHAVDRTKWYRIDYAALDATTNGTVRPSDQNGQSTSPKRTPLDMSNMDTSIPETTQILPTETIPIEPKTKRATQLPDDFLETAEMTQWAIEQGVAFRDLDRETEQFKDYHRAKGSTFKDWNAAWRTWMRNSVKFASKSNGSTYKAREVKKTAAEINEETFARMRAEREGRIQVDDAYETQWSYAE